MTLSLSKRALEVKPSTTLAITAKAKELKAKGVNVISFAAGEPDFDTPASIKNAAISAIQSGFTKYTASAGMPELKEAISRKLAQDNGLSYSPKEIIVSCGAKHSLYNIFAAIINEGNEVIIPSPYWLTYPEQVKLNDGVPVFIETSAETSYKITPIQLEAAISSSTKALVLNSPSNPTGAVYTKEELAAIAKICVANQIYVVSDEIYEKLTYDGLSHTSIASLGEDIKKVTLVVNGVSKSHSMTGWRIGYAAGPVEVIKAMDAIQGQVTSNPTSIAQKAALEALNGPQQSVKDMAAEFAARRDLFVNLLAQIPDLKVFYPSGAFYLFVDVSGLFGKYYQERLIETVEDLAEVLIEHFALAVIPTTDFGAPNCLRLSFATSRQNIEAGANRLAQAVSEFDGKSKPKAAKKMPLGPFPPLTGQPGRGLPL